MKDINKKSKLLVMIIFSVLLFSVSAAAAPKLNKKQLSIYIGQTFPLTVSSGSGSSWASSAPSVASVSSRGVITGISKGTAAITCTAGGKKLTCIVNIRKRRLSKYVSNGYVKIWMNMLGAVESGGMVYGQRDYTCFAGPGANTSAEVSSTAGAYQEYGENLRQLLIAIRTQYPYTFKKYDQAGIDADLATAWYGSNNYAVHSGSAKALSIQKIIGSVQGRLVQDIRCAELLDEYLGHIRTLGVTNLQAGLFLAQCEHLGGFAAVRRVVERSKNRNRIAALRRSLYKDDKDPTGNQIGDAFFRSRHEALYKWIVQYIPPTLSF